MADGTQRAEWSHTSSMLAMLNNVNCTDRRHLKSPSDFNPVEKSVQTGRRVAFKEQVAALKPFLVKP